MSGLRQVVLALLTLSNGGCRSLHHHNMAAETERKEIKETEMEDKMHKNRGREEEEFVNNNKKGGMTGR